MYPIQNVFCFWREGDGESFTLKCKCMQPALHMGFGCACRLGRDARHIGSQFPDVHAK
jgi:hypothetical protein